MTRRHLTVCAALLSLGVACSSGSGPEPQTGDTRSGIAGQFAEAWTRNDRAAIGRLLCPGVPAPPKIGTSPTGAISRPTTSEGPIKDIHVIGPLAKGPSTGGIIEVQDVDFHVPVEGTQDGRPVSGAIEITMGEDDSGNPCVHLYGYN